MLTEGTRKEKRKGGGTKRFSQQELLIAQKENLKELMNGPLKII